MYPHRIRLRGPWEYEPLSGPAPLPAPGRMTMPCRWKDGGLAGFSGRVRFRRHFGYPGPIDDFERIWLTFTGATGSAEVRLNGQFIGRLPEGPAEYDVTSLLKDRNVLEVEIDGGEDGGLWGETALEIRCTAFLRGLRATKKSPSTIQIAGEVAGACDRSLELYVLLDRSNVGYAVVEAGRPFQVMIEVPPGTAASVLRIELVCVATVWHAAEIPIED